MKVKSFELKRVQSKKFKLKILLHVHKHDNRKIVKLDQNFLKKRLGRMHLPVGSYQLSVGMESNFKWSVELGFTLRGLVLKDSP